VFNTWLVWFVYTVEHEARIL